MEEKTYTITLSNGTKLENLRLNGDNFISAIEISPDVFENNCDNVTISDGESETIYTDMELVQLITYNGEWWFVLREIPPDELERKRLLERIVALESNAIGGIL